MSDRQSISDSRGSDDRDAAASRWGKSTVRSRYTQSKIGGEFALEFEERHRSKDVEFVKDEFNSLEYEMDQLSKAKIDKKTKYVESLVTGQYYKVSPSFNPEDLGAGELGLDLDGDGIISTTERIDAEMKNQQKLWVNILNNGFNFTLGLLSGLSLLEVFFLAFKPDNATFISSYKNFANLACIINNVLTNMAFIFGLSLSMIYNQKANQLTLSKDQNRLEFQKLYNFTAVATFMVMLSWLALQALPKYSNQINLLIEGKMTDEDFQTFQGLSYLKDAALIVTWTIVSFNNKSSISDADLDPDDAGEDQDAEGPYDDDDTLSETDIN